MQTSIGQTDWPTFWAAVAASVAALALIASFLLWLVRKVKVHLTREVDAAKTENAKLRAELDTRLRLPEFGLQAIALSEKAAELKVEELERRHSAAVEAKDRETAESLSLQLKDVERLQQEFRGLSIERDALQRRLESRLVAPRAYFSGNAVQIPTGTILVVRHNGRYGAVLALDQTARERGSFIRYASWYQPDGSDTFVSSAVVTGFGEASEGPGRSRHLNVGPIMLEWSIGGPGIGWVYFGPSSTPDQEYALALVEERDIAKVRASTLKFLAPRDPALGNEPAL